MEGAPAPAAQVDPGSAPTTPAVQTSSVSGSGEPTGTQAPVTGSLLSPPSNEGSAPSSPAGDGIIPPVVETCVSDWRDALPPELKDNPNVSKYNSLDDMINGHINLSKMIGEKGLERPGEGATPEQWNSYYTKIGRPQTADDYSDYKSEPLIDENGNEVPQFQFNDEVLAEAKTEMHKLGLTDEQYQGVLGLYADSTMSGYQSAEAEAQVQAQEAQSELRKEFGEKYDAEMRSIGAIADKLGIRDTLIESGLGNNLTVLKMIHGLGAKIGESNITGDASAAGGGFEARKAAIMSHAGYRDKSHPEYSSLQGKFNALMKDRYS